MSLAVGDTSDVSIKFVPLCPEKYVCRDCGVVRKGLGEEGEGLSYCKYFMTGCYSLCSSTTTDVGGCAGVAFDTPVTFNVTVTLSRCNPADHGTMRTYVCRLLLLITTTTTK